MTARINHILTQKIPFGRLSISISEKEAIALRLVFAEEDEINRLWRDLWQGICSYDNLPPACRQLMPLIAGRMLECEKAISWERVNDLKLGFLRGLPRYTWTKSALISACLEKIARACLVDSIPIIAIKGASELLVGGKNARLRPTIDIDIMVKPQDVENFSQAIKRLGYFKKEYKRSTIVESAIPRSFILYENAAPGFPEIDLHLEIDNEIDPQIQLHERIWKNRLQCGACSNLYIPSPRERYEISLVNAFRIVNWTNHAYLKYIYDVISLERSQQAYLETESSTASRIRVDALLFDWQYQIQELGHAGGILDPIANDRREANADSVGSHLANILSIHLNGHFVSSTLAYIRAYIKEIGFIVHVRPSIRSIYRITVAPLLIMCLVFRQRALGCLLNISSAKKGHIQGVSKGLPAKRISLILGKR